MFEFDDFDLDQQTFQGASVNGSLTMPNDPQSSVLEDQRYVALPSQTQTHPSPMFLSLEQPVQQFQYPDPDPFSYAQPISTPYYPLQPLSPANPTMQQNLRAITPPGQQISSIDSPLFLHDNMFTPTATAGLYPYSPIQPYQDNASFSASDLALSPIPNDLLSTPIYNGWSLPSNTLPPKRSHPNDLYIPDPYPNLNDTDISDADFPPPPRAPKRPRRSRLSRPHTILPNGEAKKGRPCAKPQTEERLRVNARRMEGYYRRKYESGNLEKARQQSKESYWRRKQRRIEAGEKVRSYNAGAKKGGNSKLDRKV